MYKQIWNHTENKVHDNLIQREADGAFIPFDEQNVDYQEYKAWLDEGNQPHPHTPEGGTNGTTTKTKSTK